MTRKEAKGNLIHAFRWNDMPKKEAIDIAIKALEQEPCEDCISREAVIKMAYDMSEIDGEHFTEPHMVIDIEDIQKLPSINQEPKTGHWIPCQSGVLRICSECKNFGDLSDAYCKHCGAKMVEPQESEDKE